MTQLTTGTPAPSFTADSTSGSLSLADLLDKSQKGVVVYFYPKASTPGCTKEACDFRDSLNSLRSAGYEVVGVSADSKSVLEKFADKESLNFPLVSDPDHEILQEWGAWGEKKNYGRTYVGIIRSTVVVAKDGTVELAQYNVKATGHVARLRRDLGIDD
ncbi:thioredoxin-dependent thiol peroxidase [Schaalia vaccimaxillae]|uniref:thioredoxin-dependent thiol peroxidase n=1 Tax=Schaalia vaccimaxillae TaxID=183916 RepID=UPI0003B4ED3E|nr:thioredoxin-dependent thiol peroxidase [Schaalia vaccimaxillae]